MGCIGAGKSTVARALGKRLGLEVVHLDRLWWRPGHYCITGRSTVARNTIEANEFRRLEEEIAARDSWIIDGDASNKDVRLSRADTVVFLDLPRWLCTCGLVKRHLRRSYHYPGGVRVSFRWVLFLVRWILATWPSKRRPSLLAAIAEHASAAEVVHLRSRGDICRFLESVE